MNNQKASRSENVYMEKAKKIEGIYQAYLVQLRELNKKQREIINKFAEVIKEEKIKEIRASLHNLS